MPVNRPDIRVEKQALRTQQKQLRAAIPQQQKQIWDRRIQNKLMGLWIFRDAQFVLPYVSNPIEVDTRAVISACLEQGKTVAVPRCVPGTRELEFYRITTLSQLKPGAFGIWEPEPNPAQLWTNFSAGLCIVPALAIDQNGYRLGYGKGYYDRFLPRMRGAVVGLCYQQDLQAHISHGRYDRPLPMIITEKRVQRFL